MSALLTTRKWLSNQPLEWTGHQKELAATSFFLPATQGQRSAAPSTGLSHPCTRLGSALVVNNVTILSTIYLQSLKLQETHGKYKDSFLDLPNWA
jgi:hypothetical protein